MKWETITIDKKDKGRTAPFASVGHGRMELSSSACNLIDNYEEYKFAELLKGQYKGKLCFGVLFLKESTPNSITISRKKTGGKYIDGVTIGNKAVIGKMFGEKGIQNKTTRYDVIKEDEDPILTILV